MLFLPYGTLDRLDHFGIVAENVVSERVVGALLGLIAGNGNDDGVVGITDDFRIDEV